VRAETHDTTERGGGSDCANFTKFEIAPKFLCALSVTGVELRSEEICVKYGQNLVQAFK